MGAALPPTQDGALPSGPLGCSRADGVGVGVGVGVGRRHRGERACGLRVPAGTSQDVGSQVCGLAPVMALGLLGWLPPNFRGS